jgi:hypothetical protein
VDDADPELESSTQSICYSVRGPGASMNVSYTFNLTPSKDEDSFQKVDDERVCSGCNFRKVCD